MNNANAQQVDNLVSLLDGYAAKGGHHLNVNVLNRDTLLDAQKHPERHNNLAVRVSGFSQRFSLIGKPLQDHIIARTKHRTI